MIDDRLLHALDRLDRAVARLEEEPRASTGSGSLAALREQHAQLEARHEALRARTAAAVERLNQLLETAGVD